MTENETAILKCKIIGNPKPVIKWLKNENILIKDSREFIHLEEPNNIYKLVIRVIVFKAILSNFIINV